MANALNIWDEQTQQYIGMPILKGQDGLTPHIGENGNWFIGETDTGIKARGEDGLPGTDGRDGADGQDGLTPFINDNGNWQIGDKDTGVKAAGNVDVDDINLTVDQEYNPNSANAQSGKAVKEGIDENVGDINTALALIVNGSNALPQSILDVLSTKLGDQFLDRYHTLIEQKINTKVENEVNSEVEGAVNSKLEGVDDAINTAVEQKVENVVDGKIDTVVENRVGEVIDGKIEVAIGNKVNTAVDDAIDSRVVETVDDKVDSAIDDRINETVDNKVNDSVEEKVGQAVSDGMANLYKSFKTSVKKYEAGALFLKPNHIYGVIILGSAVQEIPTLIDEDNGESVDVPQSPETLCTVGVFNENNESVTVTGRMMGVIVGNYGDTDLNKAEAFVGGYKSLTVNKGVYTASYTTGEGRETKGTISWNTTAIVIEVSPDVQ